MPGVYSFDTLQPTNNDNKFTLLAKLLLATLNGGGGGSGGVTAPATFVDSMVGTVFDTARSTAPDGFLLCFGQSLLRSAYPDLFTAIGTTYGAADGTHFSLPDCRGRVIAGQDDMGGTSANLLTNQSGGLNGDTLGATGGEETHLLTAGELPSEAVILAAGVDLAEGADLSTSNGGGIPHNNVQPTIILNKMIFAGV